MDEDASQTRDLMHIQPWPKSRSGKSLSRFPAMLGPIQINFCSDLNAEKKPTTLLRSHVPIEITWKEKKIGELWLYFWIDFCCCGGNPFLGIKGTKRD